MNEQVLINEVIDEQLNPKPTHKLDIQTPITSKKKNIITRILTSKFMNVIRWIAFVPGIVFITLGIIATYLYYHPEIIQGFLAGV